MFMHVCDFLTEEHQKYMFTLINRKNYGVVENVNKFKREVVRFNDFSATLVHSDFEHCKFASVRTLRTINTTTRRLTAIVDAKIERAKEEQWLRSSSSMH
jgi:hypothetical protein